MNLTYVKNYLETKKETITPEDVQVLIDEINAFQGNENKLLDIASIMRTVSDYSISYITQIQEYEALPKNDIKLLPKRAEVVRGILCTLSLLHTYLVISRNNISESTFNMKNLRTYLTDLDNKKEHYKSEKMTWGSILRSITQELAFTTEMRKLDIEDKVGYIKYKES